LFYPAQFWPHKNHVRIVLALSLLRKKYDLRVPIVFCGSSFGRIRRRTGREIIRLGCELGLEKEVRMLGYVPDQDMAGLYAGSVALVMPTFFGPTNIPVLEAWASGCPVLSSDIRGIREQTRDAAVLVDPRSEESIADGIYRLWMDENLRQRLAGRGREQLMAYSSDDYRDRLAKILDEAKLRIASEKPRAFKP
jgi:glycosyltransferase involved in cell wall biosynthesis